jgi:hypothetical protein
MGGEADVGLIGVDAERPQAIAVKATITPERRFITTRLTFRPGDPNMLTQRVKAAD